MDRRVQSKIIELVIQAADLARSIGVHNLLQPGLVKEMIIAEHLGHEVILTKRDADACDPNDKNILYEYLSCKEGGTGQLDRMFKHPPAKRAESMRRIHRNAKIYFAVFLADEQTRIKAIYEIDPNILAIETERQLNISRNDISHVGFSEAWARENGRLVYPPT